MASDTIGTAKYEKVTFASSIGGGNEIAAFFAPSTSGESKGILQICHGMAEHFSRENESVICTEGSIEVTGIYSFFPYFYCEVHCKNEKDT